MHSPDTAHYAEAKSILKLADEVFAIEIKALEKVKKCIDENFVAAVRLILDCKGKIVVTGMGKSGLIASKIASTMTSTGTLAVFLHPAEALHGDVGIVESKDVVIILGKSGESEEVNSLLPVIKRIGSKIIAITGNVKSTLARYSDIILDASVDQEACGMNLAPTASTTTSLVMGDALATVLSTLKNFNEENYALFHPGGRLGKRLSYRVTDFMYSIDEIAVAKPDDNLTKVFIKMSEKNHGAILIIDENGILSGIICDGDIKRILTKFRQVENLIAADVMTKSPKTISEDTLAYDALLTMEKSNSFFVMPVINQNNQPVGLLRMHDLLKAGL